MHVVRHEHIGMNGASEEFTAMRESVAVELKILFVDKHDVTVVASLNNMLRISRQRKTRLSSHDGTSKYRVA
jgi:hypothetical protein